MSIVKNTIRVALLATLVVMMATSVFAASTLMTSQAGYTGPDINLAAYADGSYNYTFGPVPIPGGITFTANPGGGAFPLGGNSGLGSVIGQGGYGLLANGSFGLPAVYMGVDSGTGFDTLTFATPVSQIGGFFNYAPGAGGTDATISAFGIGGNLLATYDLETLAPISTPGGFNEFAFRGIADSSADIASFEFGGDYLLMSGAANGAVPTPEPASLGLLVVGLFGVGLFRRSLRHNG